jgi:hypothetical protein
LLQLKFEIFDDCFKPCSIEPGFIACSTQAVQNFGSVEEFPATISFDHCDRNGFDTFVSGEAKITVKTFPATTHAASTICSSGFQNATICVLAGGALHAQSQSNMHQLYALISDLKRVVRRYLSFRHD